MTCLLDYPTPITRPAGPLAAFTEVGSSLGLTRSLKGLLPPFRGDDGIVYFGEKVEQTSSLLAAAQFSDWFVFVQHCIYGSIPKRATAIVMANPEKIVYGDFAPRTLTDFDE